MEGVTRGWNILGLSHALALSPLGTSARELAHAETESRGCRGRWRKPCRWYELPSLASIAFPMAFALANL